MQCNFRRISSLVAVATLSIAAAGTAAAQTYPSKPIRIVSQFTSGSVTDTLARLVAEKMSQNWGQQVIVETHPGAGGVIGTQFGAKANPDGYTLVMAPVSALATAPHVIANLPYDPLRDFEPISNLVASTQMLVAHPDAPFKTLPELVAYAKANPGKVNYGSQGNGSFTHLAMEVFRSTAGIDMTHVPFKSSSDLYLMAIGGQIQVMSEAMPSALPHVKAGKLRALALSAPQRSPLMPDLPTVAEQGYPDYSAIAWTGIVAPAKTPPDVLDKLNAEMVRIMNLPDVRERFQSISFTTIGNSRQEFKAYIKAEYDKWGKAVRDSGAKVD